MKYARVHTHNGVTHDAGDRFVGDTQTGRFLYQRGVLAPDGGVDDASITRDPGPRARQRWGYEEAPPAPPPPPPAPSLDDLTLETEKE